MVWTRPANVPYPSVWHTFRAKDVDSDQLVNYVVQDLPEERFEEAIGHMLGIFIHDEPTCEAKSEYSASRMVIQELQLEVDC